MGKLKEYLLARLAVVDDSMTVSEDNRQLNFHRGQIDAYNDILDFLDEIEDAEYLEDEAMNETDLKYITSSLYEERRKENCDYWGKWED